MKQFLFKLVLFLSFIIIIDLIIGVTSDILRRNAKGGSTANNYYIAEECKDDIIILGSSRASHHYIPEILETSLGLSCYNCGEEGNGIILGYGRYKMITDHHIPKIIIYEVTPEYDWTIGDNSQFTRYLKPYCHNPAIYDLVTNVSDSKERFKLLSQMYRNNSSFVTYIVDNLIYRDNAKGYSPMWGTMKEPIEERIDTVNSIIDEQKIFLLEEMIKDSHYNGIELLFVVSPYYWRSKTQEKYAPIIDLCEKYDVDFLDFRNIEGITENLEAFNDAGHMNHIGAIQYTEFISKFLQTSMYLN